MRFIVLAVLLALQPSKLFADELAEAKEEYLNSRRQSARQLYAAYQNAISAAEKNGADSDADALRRELDAFVAHEQVALKMKFEANAFDLFATINQALVELETAQKLPTDVQRKASIRDVIARLNREIANKPFTAEFIIEEVKQSRYPDRYEVHFGSYPAAEDGLGNARLLASYRIQLTDREVKNIVPGDRLRLSGRLHSGVYPDFSSPPGTSIFSIDLPHLDELYVVAILSPRAVLVRDPKKKASAKNSLPEADQASGKISRDATPRNK